MTHRKVRLPLAWLQVFSGISAVSAGAALVLAHPVVPRWLYIATPRDFLLSGIALALVGAASLVSAAAILSARHGAVGSAIVSAAGIVAWALANIALAGPRTWVDPLFAVVGVATIVAAVVLAIAEAHQGGLESHQYAPAAA
jgi:hypothetical protein